MRLRRTLRNEHAGGDFGVRIALGRQHHGLALAVGQRVEQGARLIAARTRPRDAQIVDQLFLTGRVELRRALAYPDDAADDIVRRIGFRHEPLGARLHRAFHGAGRTQRGQDQHVRRGGERAQQTGRLDAVHAGHGDVHQHHIRLFLGSPPHAGLAIGGRGDDFDAPVRIIVEDQAHRLADHRIVIDDADPDRLGL